jgi:uncharacterized membrane protein YeaQ/YmgE (transglycosylase-associated protein family)
MTDPRANVTPPGTTNASERRMQIITALFVGLVSGMLASGIVGRAGFGLVGDILLGFAGAYVGGYMFAHTAWHVPFGGLAGAIFVGTIGAAILLFAAHLIHYMVTHRSRRLA